MTLTKGFLGCSASDEGQRWITRLGYGRLPEPLRTRLADAVGGLF
ncbi:hypothetical protein ACFY3U_14900 [Micromonospora sp. NPDC000089]